MFEEYLMDLNTNKARVVFMSDKNPGGRPTKYNDEMVKKARYYLENFEAIGDQIPSIAGLSIYLGMNRTYLYEWRKDSEKEEFSDILEQILTTQENVLINKGIEQRVDN